jgi:hypothetical protein
MTCLTAGAVFGDLTNSSTLAGAPANRLVSQSTTSDEGESRPPHALVAISTRNYFPQRRASRPADGAPTAVELVAAVALEPVS